ncbi:MAG: hypothetical protein K2N43_02815 [Lachnospiraceae bacterium]|nr:hypothetical protein [Lachnospiraceae bacterium]
MNIKHFFTKRTFRKIASCICILCLPALAALTYWVDQRVTTLFLQGSQYFSPKQDTDGYYLLRTAEDFKWFIATINHGNSETNVRLCNDLILNDTSDWENWADTPPENTYHPMSYYNGHFDGGGFALDGYYPSFNEADSFQAFIFTFLEENARISDLHIRNSFFRTTYEDSSYEDDEGEINVVPAAVLCFSNDGIIENCDIHAKVLGAWSAGGIAAVNNGQIVNCHFSGSVEAGLAGHIEKPENRLRVNTLHAGGICRRNEGIIRGCVNDGNITLHSLQEDYYMNYAAGGIVGINAANGIMEDTENNGPVTSAQLAGGIAGANWGGSNRCVNRGNVHVEEAADLDHTDSFISAGICASNGGTIDTCIHTGAATINQTNVSYYAPIHGIACNIINPDKGSVTNCYYVKENTAQAYRQSGVYKLSARDTADLSVYLDGTKKIEDIDNWNLLSELPSYPGTDEDDYIHLGFGPASDVIYEVQPGDSFWKIAEEFYGDGRYYDILQQEAATSFLSPGDRLTIPHKDYYLLRTNDEEGHGWCTCELPSGGNCPTHFNAAKPIDWYYGYMYIDASKGFDAMWPKDKTLGHDVPASDIRILYRLDGNPEGNFFEDWEAVQKSIRKSARACCGDSIDNLRFYCYTLDSGEKLYGWSFRLYRSADILECAAFYRIREGFMAEYIGIAPIEEEEPVLERVRYLAAEIKTESLLTSEEIQRDCEEFYGRENWDFPLLHNPFATALSYDKDAECNSYMHFTGSQ